MQRMSVLVSVLLLVSGACTALKPGYCKSNSDCPGGQHCNLDWPDKFKCTAATGDAGDAGGADGSESGARDGRDDSTGSAPDGPDAHPGCLGDQACPADQPICLSGACSPCAAAPADACAQRDPSRALCGGTGACVECAGNSDCSRDPNKPICVSGVCSACAAGLLGACAKRDPSHPVCAVAGVCVGCSGSADCSTDPAKPICDLTTNACVACESDAQCAAKGTGPGVCMAHQDGRCATDAETIYVANNAGCASASAAGGPTTTPYCSLTPAVLVLDTVHRLIVIRGAVGGSTSTIQGGSGTSPISIVGQKDAVVAAPGPESILHVTGADLFIRSVAFKNSLDVGVRVDGGSTIRLDTVGFDGNSKGGLLIDSAAFDIRNSVFTNNGPGTLGAVTWGGILVQGSPQAGPRALTQVTIAGNKQIGLSCSSPISATGVYATGNAGGVDVSPTCGFTSCMPAGVGCGATP